MGDIKVNEVKTDTIQASTGSTVSIASGHVLYAPGHVVQMPFTQYTSTIVY